MRLGKRVTRSMSVSGGFASGSPLEEAVLMLKVDSEHGKLVALGQLELRPSRIAEHHQLRELILNSADAFFKEIGQHVFVIGKDILGLDESGNAVNGVCTLPKPQGLVSGLWRTIRARWGSFKSASPSGFKFNRCRPPAGRNERRL